MQDPHQLPVHSQQQNQGTSGHISGLCWQEPSSSANLTLPAPIQCLLEGWAVGGFWSRNGIYVSTLACAVAAH